MAEAIAAVIKQREEALANQQTLLSLCKGIQPGAEAPTVQRKTWAEGMAGLSMFMSVCNELGSTLSDEDKALLSTLQHIQGRLAVQTTVVDTEDTDQHMEAEAEGGSNTLRAQEDDASNAKSKRQKQRRQPSSIPKTRSGHGQ